MSEIPPSEDAFPAAHPVVLRFRDKISDLRGSNLWRALVELPDFVQQAIEKGEVSADALPTIVRELADGAFEYSFALYPLYAAHPALASWITEINESFDIAQAAVRLEEGQFIQDQWRLEKELGKGGFGQVFLAIHQEIGERRAIKFIPAAVFPPLVAGEWPRSFRREIQACQTAHAIDPAFVRIVDYGVVPGGFVIHMEPIEGETLLNKVCREGSMRPGLAVDKLLAVVRAMSKAYAKSALVHRDLKPSNIMLEPSGDVRILDLGLARHGVDFGIDFPDSRSGTQQSIMTLLGGTPGYSAPESADPTVAAKPTADIYGLGATLLFLLTGKEPISEVQYGVSPWGRTKPLLPELLAICHKCLETEPERRFASYDALFVALEQVHRDPYLETWRPGFVIDSNGIVSPAQQQAAEQHTTDASASASADADFTVDSDGVTREKPEPSATERSDPPPPPMPRIPSVPFTNDSWLNVLVILVIFVGIWAGYSWMYSGTLPPRVVPVVTPPKLPEMLVRPDENNPPSLLGETDEEYIQRVDESKLFDMYADATVQKTLHGANTDTGRRWEKRRQAIFLRMAEIQRGKVLPLSAEVEAKLNAHATFVVNTDGWPSWSHDGDKLLFVDDGKIKSKDVGSGKVEDLGVQGTNPVLTADGKYLAFIRTSGTSSAVAIAIRNLASGETADISISERHAHPQSAKSVLFPWLAWAGKPQRLYFCSVIGNSFPLQTATPSSNGKWTREFIESKLGDNVAVTPDGHWFAFVAYGLDKIFIYHRNGEKLDLFHAVSEPFGRKRRPRVIRWSPDGRELAIGSSELDNAGLPQEASLFVYNVENKKSTEVFRGPIEGAEWSPRGDRLALLISTRRNEGLTYGIVRESMQIWVADIPKDKSLAELFRAIER